MAEELTDRQFTLTGLIELAALTVFTVSAGLMLRRIRRRG